MTIAITSIRAISISLASAFVVPVHALDLSSPVDCEIGRECPIMQVVDRDPTEGVADTFCGSLSYDGHNGVDFSLTSWARMAEGVEVVASAPGRVRGIRDGMRDRGGYQQPNGDVTGRECGNGVAIEHADGWITQYCHLRRGSIVVETGDEISTGDKLGLIGASGRADFPHLHFSIRRNGDVVDPFDGRAVADQCAADPATEGLWIDDDLNGYRAGGILSMGFLDRVPEYEDVWNSEISFDVFPDDAAAFVAWGHAYGLREGDIIDIRIVSPTGEDFARDEYEMPRNRATQFRAFGRRLPNEDAPPGLYTAEVKLFRDGDIVDQLTSTIELP